MPSGEHHHRKRKGERPPEGDQFITKKAEYIVCNDERRIAEALNSTYLPQLADFPTEFSITANKLLHNHRCKLIKQEPYNNSIGNLDYPNTKHLNIGIASQFIQGNQAQLQPESNSVGNFGGLNQVLLVAAI